MYHQTGYSPSKLILHYRMELAKQSLGSSQYSITEIAHQCGFSRPGIFSRKFKQEFGSPPSEYRKKILNEQPESYHWKIPLNERSLSKLLHIRNKNKWLEKMFVIVIDNLDNELFSLELLSRELFMSSSNLNRKVKYLFGLSTMKLVRDIRLQQASELLSLQNKSVTEVASLTGFFDVAHLSRYFKQTFGCSPSEYRNTSVCFSCIDRLLKE
ncbi:MAG: AraC-like DNA-binding protein [Dokdonia sp.]